MRFNIDRKGDGFVSIEMFISLYGKKFMMYWEFNITPQFEISRTNDYYCIIFKFLIFGLEITFR